MKHSFTAMVTIAAAAGFAGMVQAQTTAPTTTPPAQSFQGAAPSAQYNQYQSTTAPSYQTGPNAAPTTDSQAGMQQPTAMQQPTGMQQPAPTAMQQPAGMQPSSSAGLSSRSSAARDDLMRAQEQLQAQGLYRGPIDGVMGSGTRRGLAQFQRQNGLPPSGTLDPQTLASLSGGGMSNAGSPSVGGGTPPVGTSAPLGTGTQAGSGAPLGASGQNYNGPSTQGTQNTDTQPSANPQPATR
jgi:peptidoglycan hydrolase-like protein with peptidoglycan-binding domain